MPTMTLMEQKLIIAMYNNPVTSKGQKIYRNKANFYTAVWKLRDAHLIISNVTREQMKEWHLTTDGQILARVFMK